MGRAEIKKMRRWEDEDVWEGQKLRRLEG